MNVARQLNQLLQLALIVLLLTVAPKADVRAFDRAWLLSPEAGLQQRGLGQDGLKALVRTANVSANDGDTGPDDYGPPKAGNVRTARLLDGDLQPFYGTADLPTSRPCAAPPTGPPSLV